MASYTIQTNPTFPADTSGNINVSPKVCVDSNGRLYSAYVYNNGVETFAVAYSDDSGANWTEVTTASFTANVAVWSVTIDSSDTLHIVYCRNGRYILYYRSFQNGVFGAEETIFDGSGNTDDINSANLDIAIDSSDIPHVVWSQYEPTTADPAIYYSNRSGGSWAVRTKLSTTSSPSTNRKEDPRIVFDNNDRIWVFWKAITGGGSDTALFYNKYVSGWVGPVQLFTSSNETAGRTCLFSVVIDTSDNVHAVVLDGVGTDSYKHLIYTAGTDSWSSASSITTTGVDKAPCLGIDSNGLVHLVWGDGGNNCYYSSYNGSWAAPSTILSSVAIYATFNTPIFPLLGGVSTQRQSAGYHFIYRSTIGATTIIAYYRTSDLTLQVPQDENYSRKAAAALPSDDANLSTLFTSTGYTNVATENGVYEDQSATDQYAIVQFKNKGNSSSDNINVTWIGRTTIAPSASTVYLQIYNRNSGLWETLDSDTTTAADTPFTLTGTKTSSLSNYYDGSNWVSCRVYQLAA